MKGSSVRQEYFGKIFYELWSFVTDCSEYSTTSKPKVWPPIFPTNFSKFSQKAMSDNYTISHNKHIYFQHEQFILTIEYTLTTDIDKNTFL